jgi:hypothetical protein
MIDPDLALREAVAEATELADDPSWKVAFAGAVPGPAILVRDRSRRGERDYFIVDFRIGERSTGRMIVNATTGVIDEVMGIEEEGEALSGFITESAVLGRMRTRIILDDGRVVEPPADPSTIEVVWEPSRQSQTRFEPFYRVSWPSDELYFRVDGRVFPKLTPPGLPDR